MANKERYVPLEMTIYMPVVKCEDCQWCRQEDEYEYWCNGWGWPARLTRPEDYCSRGEERIQ